jgi:glutathione S-transferase
MDIPHVVRRLDFQKMRDPHTEEYQTLYRINPQLKVPVLVHSNDDEEIILTESLAICRYVCSLKPSDPCNLIPPSSGRAARVDEIICHLITELESNLWLLDKALCIKVPFLNPDIAEYAIPQVTKALKVIEAWLAESNFVARDSFSLADVFCYHLVTWATLYVKEPLSEKMTFYLSSMEKRDAFPKLMKGAGSPALPS